MGFYVAFFPHPYAEIIERLQKYILFPDIVPFLFFLSEVHKSRVAARRLQKNTGMSRYKSSYQRESSPEDFDDSD